ncbi:MAG: hypothetical protein NUW01_14200 [Gemmatimonadaceae bacterium]|nr:hypothetical protein [Gemmatimonadaceae bacterium]
MPVRYLEPKRPGENFDQFSQRQEDFWQTVEQDRAQLKALRASLPKSQEMKRKRRQRWLDR